MQDRRLESDEQGRAAVEEHDRFRSDLRREMADLDSVTTSRGIMRISQICEQMCSKNCATEIKMQI